MTDAMRLDKWLWAARFYKSRSLAQAACDGGKVDVNAQAAKPSRSIRSGDRIRLTVGEWRREVAVKALTERRGPAAEARALYDDLSPPPPPRALRPPRAVVRAPGLGRPTKRERRLHERLRGF
ncbi:MAG TPA: RNA-binding S4 domain-containing protein [Methylomirabilota bacterium]|jgi:ribosome-associated heat shock protein Hsp15